MVMKHYPPQFKVDAVALYRSRPGATIKSVAEDLGVNTETLRNWIRSADGRRPGSHSTPGATASAPAPDSVQAELAAARKRIRELEEERDILRKAARYFAGETRWWTAASSLPTTSAATASSGCARSWASRSSFYHWLGTAGQRAARQAQDAETTARIRAAHAASDGTYGVPRITAELRESGERVNHKKVARLMKATGIAGLRLRRKHRTTIADPAAVKAPDLVGRDFTAEVVNTKYVGDITYLSVGSGKFCYLATVIDLYSRRLAGWAIADHMRAELVVDALTAAERTRGSLAGAVMHTDHGSQYTSRAFAEACRRAGVTQSMSAVGSSADNALAESFNGTVKRETLQGRKGWSSEREARLELFRWLHRYNTVRRRSRLGQRSPIAYETALNTTSTTLAQAALPRVQHPGSTPARDHLQRQREA
jgi:transposase InsO family protein/transposase-like protein